MAKNSGTTSGPIDWEYVKMLRTYSRYISLIRVCSLEWFEEMYWERGRVREASRLISQSFRRSCHGD